MGCSRLGVQHSQLVSEAFCLAVSPLSRSLSLANCAAICRFLFPAKITCSITGLKPVGSLVKILSRDDVGRCCGIVFSSPCPLFARLCPLVKWRKSADCVHYRSSSNRDGTPTALTAVVFEAVQPAGRCVFYWCVPLQPMKSRSASFTAAGTRLAGFHRPAQTPLTSVLWGSSPASHNIYSAQGPVGWVATRVGTSPVVFNGGSRASKRQQSSASAPFISYCSCKTLREYPIPIQFAFFRSFFMKTVCFNLMQYCIC